MSQKREILTLRVAPWDSRHHRARRVDSGLLAEQIVGDVRITNPDVHLTANGGTEYTIVFITKLFHSEPRRVGVDIMHPSDIGDRAGWTGEELETRRWSISHHISYDLDGSDENENARANEPFVGSNGVECVLGLEKSVGGLIGVEIIVNLGHDDRRRDRGRHD